ncbi:hypothetical protein CPB84DRAFT_1814979 [Gymnopilus junonius]|uniref:Uncharacterized protein n=1 Tax=Gymnopilus junonius TaxID=109634 RepID=A0A9P5NSD9_GYMJU|nr:hypothetical protein CPB84DRAFT_1814979 [Gymnopilus junonius]
MSSSESSPYAFAVTSGLDIPDTLLDQCAKLFSAHYGVWNDQAAIKISPFLKAGQHVKLSTTKLRAECLEPPARSVLATCFTSDELVGHAFATTWDYEGGTVGWVTQLVGIATQLLQKLKPHPLFQNVTAVGLASSHPASVAALAKYNDVNQKVHEIDTKFISTTAPKILASTPVNYLKGAPLLGSLFSTGTSENDLRGIISAIDTQFYVDHAEPLEDKQGGGWCLGELKEGHEFLIVVPVSHEA